MNSYRRLSLVLLATLTAGITSQTQAQMKIEPPIYIREQLAAMKKAFKDLDKIRFEIQELDQKTTLTLSGFENLDKKDVIIERHVEKFDLEIYPPIHAEIQGWHVTINVENGVIEFFISANKIEVVRYAKVTLGRNYDIKERSVMQYQGLMWHRSVHAVIEYGAKEQRFRQPIDIDSFTVDKQTSSTVKFSADKQEKSMPALAS